MCVCVTVGMEIDAEYDSGSDGKFWRWLNFFYEIDEINFFINIIVYHYYLLEFYFR